MENVIFQFIGKILKCNVQTKITASLMLFPLQLQIICFSGYGIAVCMVKTTKRYWLWKQKSKENSYIYSTFRLSWWFFWFCTIQRHPFGLTSIPWWLPTYFSSLPAMNFNESLPLPKCCHVWYLEFFYYTFTFSWQNHFGSWSTCVADCSERNPRQNSQIKSISAEFVGIFFFLYLCGDTEKRKMKWPPRKYQQQCRTRHIPITRHM